MTSPTTTRSPFFARLPRTRTSPASNSSASRRRPGIGKVAGDALSARPSSAVSTVDVP